MITNIKSRDCTKTCYAHDAPRSNGARDVRSAIMCPNYERSLNVVQTVRSCENNLGTPDEMFFNAQRGVVSQNVFICKCARAVQNIE